MRVLALLSDVAGGGEGGRGGDGDDVDVNGIGGCVDDILWKGAAAMGDVAAAVVVVDRGE